MAISKPHIEFIQLIAKGVQQEDAYRTTIGNKATTKSTAASRASKLCKRYSKEITEIQEKTRKVIEQASESKDVKNALKSILTQAEVDAKLCSIINGELQEVQVLIGTKVVKALITPTITEMKQAADTYYKRFGSYAPTKSQVEVTELPSPQIILTKP